MGQQIGQDTTATGLEMAVNMSFAQTEMYFVQHSEYLMPRVHQMRTDLAQYYNSTKPSVRLQYMTSMDEKVNFQMNGTELLARELNIFTSTKINQREIAEKIKNLALNNNTAGASIFDLGNIIKADSIAEITHTLKAIEEKTNKIKEQEQQHEQQLTQMEQEAESQRQEQKLKFEAEQNQLDRESDEKIAEIKAAGYTGQQDFNQNSQSDYIDTLEYLDKKNAKQEDQALARTRELNKNIFDQQKLQLSREELNTRERIANKQVQVARINKNKYDKK